MAAVHDRFSKPGMTWDDAWNTCADITHKSVFQAWMSKVKSQPEDLTKKAADLVNALPPSGEIDARNERLRQVVELVNEVMTKHPRMSYDAAFASARRDNPNLFDSMKQPARQVNPKR